MEVARSCWACSEQGAVAGSEAISLEISTRNARVMALQKRWDQLRSAFEELLDQRGTDMAEIPGGALFPFSVGPGPWPHEAVAGDHDRGVQRQYAAARREAPHGLGGHHRVYVILCAQRSQQC
jgi:hypothetical protein